MPELDIERKIQRQPGEKNEDFCVRVEEFCLKHDFTPPIYLPYHKDAVINFGSEWESKEDWKDKVCEPIIKYPLAPRDALKLLEIAGRLSTYGIGIELMLKMMSGEGSRITKEAFKIALKEF